MLKALAYIIRTCRDDSTLYQFLGFAAQHLSTVEKIHAEGSARLAPLWIELFWDAKASRLETGFFRSLFGGKVDENKAAIEALAEVSSLAEMLEHHHKKRMNDSIAARLGLLAAALGNTDRRCGSDLLEKIRTQLPPELARLLGGRDV